MSPDFREQSEKSKIGELDGVIFTHAHHILGNFHLPHMLVPLAIKNTLSMRAKPLEVQ